MEIKADHGEENQIGESEVINGEIHDQTENANFGNDAESDNSNNNEEENDEVIVSIGEEAPPQEEQTQAPEWVRELRKTNRELQRQNRELQGKLQATSHTENKPVALGAKPTLEAHDYDAERFEEALANWFERKRQADEENAKQEAKSSKSSSKVPPKV